MRNADESSDYWHELAAFILNKALADGRINLGEAGGAIEEYPLSELC